MDDEFDTDAALDMRIRALVQVRNYSAALRYRCIRGSIVRRTIAKRREVIVVHVNRESTVNFKSCFEVAVDVPILWDFLDTLRCKCFYQKLNG